MQKKPLFQRSRSAQIDLVFSHANMKAATSHAVESTIKEEDSLTQGLEDIFKTGSTNPVHDYLQDIDQLVNNKISLGMKNMMQMVVKKLVVLIEERVNSKVSEELLLNQNDLKMCIMKEVSSKLYEFSVKLEQLEDLRKEILGQSGDKNSGLRLMNQNEVMMKSKQVVQFKEVLDNSSSPLVTKLDGQSPCLTLYNSERQTMQSAGDQSRAQRRKSRAENLSPVDEKLSQKISQLKSDAEKLKYMNKSRQSPLNQYSSARKPSQIMTSCSTQLQGQSSQTSLNAKPSQKNLLQVKTVRPGQQVKIKKIIGCSFQTDLCKSQQSVMCKSSQIKQQSALLDSSTQLKKRSHNQSRCDVNVTQTDCNILEDTPRQKLVVPRMKSTRKTKQLTASKKDQSKSSPMKQ